MDIAQFVILRDLDNELGNTIILFVGMQEYLSALEMKLIRLLLNHGG